MTTPGAGGSYGARRRGVTATAYWLASDMVVDGSSKLLSWADRINSHNMGPQAGTGAPQVTTAAGWKALSTLSGIAACNVSAIGNAADGFGVWSLVFRLQILVDATYLGWTTSAYGSKHTIQTTGGGGILRCRRFSTTTNAYSNLGVDTYGAGTFTIGIDYDGANYSAYKNGTSIASGVAGSLSVDAACDRFAFLTGTANYIGAVKLWVGSNISAAQHASEHTALAAVCP